MQTILVTGANGFVGAYLIKSLLSRELKVVGTGIGAERHPHHGCNYRYLELDIRDIEAVSRVFKEVKPDVVVHTAAMTKPDDCQLNQETAWAVNVQGTENLLSAASYHHAYFLHLSTDFVFAGSRGLYNEEDEQEPVNFYGLTKKEAELRVKAYEGPWAIARPMLVYGQPYGGRQNIVTVVAAALRAGKTLNLFTDQKRLPLYVSDFVWGLEQMIEKECRGIYHFCGREALSPFEIGIRVARHLGLDEGLIAPVTAASFPQPAPRPPQSIFDLKKVQDELGFAPLSFGEGLRRTFEMEAALNKREPIQKE